MADLPKISPKQQEAQRELQKWSVGDLKGRLVVHHGKLEYRQRLSIIDRILAKIGLGPASFRKVVEFCAKNNISCEELKEKTIEYKRSHYFLKGISQKTLSEITERNSDRKDSILTLIEEKNIDALNDFSPTTREIASLNLDETELTELISACIVAKQHALGQIIIAAAKMENFFKIDHLESALKINKLQVGGLSGVSAKEAQAAIETALRGEATDSYKFWRNENGEPKHVVKKLGSGSFSTVYLMLDFDTGRTGVFKKIKKRDNRQDAKKEYRILKKIGGAWGIQKKPFKCVAISVQSRKDPSVVKERFGVIQPKYSIDYFDYIKQNEPISLRDGLIQMHQLLFALKYLEDQKILHGDIKPENILVDGPLVHLADFGGAKSEDTKAKKLRDVTYTPGYTSQDDRRAVRLCTNQQEVVAIEKLRDVFSMGMTLYMAFEKSKAYEEIDEFPKPPYLEMSRDDVPDEVKDIIRQMCDLDYRKRPARDEVFERFDAYLQANHPNVYAEIEQLKAMHGYS